MKRTISGLASLSLAFGLLWSIPLPAAAAVCQSGGDYNIDCTEPNSWPSCNGSDSTPRSTWVDGLGYLELRYDSGCRTVWARVPIAAFNLPWAQRATCLSGNTYGIFPNGSNSNHAWSRQLNDKNCTARAYVVWNDIPYTTEPAY